ncbi:cilia- and flagella-associated protein 184 [Sinocyclocheilus rhinocerous]|uniref:CCDC113/CCDC96 coiled-coil domain-containing protein n=1 Tax=Sinocyclocheilus rhinocerous TaxID=307959 RepID=A0A673LJB3_9TELE|nr:PREDICTED: coiled-coil domain-containing protein 96 [Sinocyclocheilus rhinocerous]
MEEESLELKHEESPVLENTLVENTETIEDPTEAGSAQVGEEESEETEPLNISEGVEDDVVKQGSQLTEDMSIVETSEPQISETEFGQHMITEEEDGIEPLINETLEDTEGPEIGHFIDDLLSREDTEEEEEGDRHPAPDPERERTSPPNESTVPAEEEETGLNINTTEYMALLPELQAESETLSKLNGQLQTKIAEYLSKKAGDKHPRLDGDISDQEQYQKYLDLTEELKVQHHRVSELHQQRTEELRQQSLEKLKQVEHELRSLAALKYEAAMTALTGKVGKQAALAKVEKLQSDELKQEDKLASVRLNNIKLKNKICQLETELKSKRELADGLLLMDFEQLKTENQAFKDKLKERSEELLRLKRKVACSVQGISHVKEKLHFMQMENKVKHTQLAKTDTLVALKREVLTRTRQARDGLRADNLKLQQRCGLLGNTTLLQDFEEKVDTSECLQQRLEMLKRRHAELTLKCAGVKQKIEQSKPEGQ